MSTVHLQAQTPCTLQPVGLVTLAFVKIDWCEVSTREFSYICFWGSWLSCFIRQRASRPEYPELRSGEQARAPLYCSPLLCPPSSRAMEELSSPAGFSKSDPLEGEPITEVGMTYSHPSLEGNAPLLSAGCLKVEAALIDPSICLIIFAQPELILCPPHFLLSGCLADQQRWQGAYWAWWSWNAERLQLSLHFGAIGSVVPFLQISFRLDTRRLTQQT